MLGGLQLWIVSGLKGEANAIWYFEIHGSVPSDNVELQHDTLAQFFKYLYLSVFLTCEISQQ